MTDDGAMAGEGWALLDRVLGWARAAGLYAIVDLHAAPGGQTGINHDDGPGYPLMFYVPRDRDLTVKLWQAIAQRYAGDPTILGYDLLNEPIAPYHDIATLNPRLEPFYKRVTAAIRAVDPGPRRDPGGGAVELELRHVRAAVRAATSPTPIIRSGRARSATRSSAISTSRTATTCPCSSARPAS